MIVVEEVSLETWFVTIKEAMSHVVDSDLLNTTKVETYKR